MYYSPRLTIEQMKMKFKILEGFEGSPDGIKVVIYAKGTVVDGDSLGGELVDVALSEEWIEAVKEKAKGRPKKEKTETGS